MECWIVTGAGPQEGTQCPVFLRLTGSKGSTEPVNVQKLRGAEMGRGGVAHFILDGPDVGPLTQAEFTFRPLAAQSSWQLNYLLVRRAPGAAFEYFPCGHRFTGGKGEVKKSFAPAPLIRKPVYVIAHMCSTPSLVQEGLDAGANAVEFDVQVSCEASGALKVKVNHGGLAGKLMYGKRSDLEWDFDDFIRQLCVHQHRLAMFMLDIKEPGEGVDLVKYGKLLASRLKPHFPPEQIVFSIPYEWMKPIYDAAVAEDMKGMGLDISVIDMSPGNRSPEFWIQTAEKAGVTWLSLGRDQRSGMMVSPWIPVIRTALQKRKKVKKVYFWTLDNEGPMDNVLCEGLDGLIVNDAAAMRRVLDQPHLKALYELAPPVQPA